MTMWEIRHSHLARRLLLLVALLASTIRAGNASAHVSVNPPMLRTNSFESFTIRVPTEGDQPTVKVRIEFPATLLVSRFQPMPSWTRSVEKDATGRIAAATWSGGSIAADEYDDFVFLARTPKDPGKLIFKTYQTYQGGETVAWVNGEGQDNPAPVVEVVAGPAPAGTAGGPTEAAEIPGATAPPTGSEATIPTARGATAGITVGPTAANVTVPAATASLVTPIPASGTLADSGAGTGDDRSDLPLFVALTALVVALVALALAGVGLVRRGTA